MSALIEAWRRQQLREPPSVLDADRDILSSGMRTVQSPSTTGHIEACQQEMSTSLSRRNGSLDYPLDLSLLL